MPSDTTLPGTSAVSPQATAPQPVAPQPPAPPPAGDPSRPPRPARPSTLPIRSVCRIVGTMTNEMVALVGSRVQMRGDLRRTRCHTRQIAMYVCHVALRIPLHDIGLAFGRDRTTVGHACNVVEDRRDDAAFDDFVAAVERMVTSVFSASEIARHG